MPNRIKISWKKLSLFYTKTHWRENRKLKWLKKRKKSSFSHDDNESENLSIFSISTPFFHSSSLCSHSIIFFSFCCLVLSKRTKKICHTQNTNFELNWNVKESKRGMKHEVVWGLRQFHNVPWKWQTYFFTDDKFI